MNAVEPLTYSRIRSYLPWGFIHRWQGVTPPATALSILVCDLLTQVLPASVLKGEPLRDLSGRLGDDGSSHLTGLPPGEDGELLYVTGSAPLEVALAGAPADDRVATELDEFEGVALEDEQESEARASFLIRVTTAFERFEGSRAIFHTVKLRGHDAPLDLSLREWLLQDGVVVDQFRLSLQRYERRFASVLGYTASPIERVTLEGTAQQLSVVAVIEDPTESARVALYREQSLLPQLLQLSGMLQKES